jgi:aquaporin Z
MTEAAVPPPAPTLSQKLSAEAIGTFVLILFGVGTAVVTEGGDYAAIGLAFGIAIVAMVYAFGRISGGHFNPAVSVGAALGGRISWSEAGAYIGAQVVGAIVGGILIVLMVVTGDMGPEIGDDAFGANFFGDRGGFALGGALIIEVVMTFIFLMVILAVTDTRNEHPGMAPLAIGLTLAAIHFASMAATGTSVNPARSLSTVFFSGGDAIAQIWVFLLAPLVGAALAGLAYPALFGHGTEPVAGSGLKFGGAPAAAPAYAAPDQYQQQWNQQAAQGQWPQQQQQQPAQPVEQPIIQDGWQWDPQAQQWIPAQQQPPAPGGEQTQVRPPGQ